MVSSQLQPRLTRVVFVIPSFMSAVSLLQAMITCYPAGASAYLRHIDNPSSDGRIVTCIMYLNKDWDVEVSDPRETAYLLSGRNDGVVICQVYNQFMARTIYIYIYDQCEG